jgi:hypothetical protein
MRVSIFVAWAGTALASGMLWVGAPGFAFLTAFVTFAYVKDLADRERE